MEDKNNLGKMKTEEDIRNKVREIRSRMQKNGCDLESIDFEVERVKHDLLLWVLGLAEESAYHTPSHLMR